VSALACGLLLLPVFVNNPLYVFFLQAKSAGAGLPITAIALWDRVPWL
jgi:hypothetical protein